MLYWRFIFCFRNSCQEVSVFSVTKTSNRLTYLDWMRGLGVLIMLQGHVMDSWLRPQDRSGEWFWWSQFLGGLPAPIFLFLVGVSLALVLDRMRRKGATRRELVARVLRRGGWILFLAYAFRLEQFLVWYPASEWSGLLKVDTLNCIAACTTMIGLSSAVFSSRKANIAAMSALSLAFVIVTPLVFQLRGSSSLIMSYVNGNDHPAYFSFFPWGAFTFVGIAFGYFLLEAKEQIGEPEFFKRVAVAGVLIYAVGAAMSLTRIFEYGFFDYSLTSPHFFLVRLGWILLILYGAYVWSARRAVDRWSPLITLGQASLIVYWLHIEIVYGRLSHGLMQSLELPKAAMQLLWLLPLMLVVASRKRLLAWAADRFGNRVQRVPSPWVAPRSASPIGRSINESPGEGNPPLVFSEARESMSGLPSSGASRHLLPEGEGKAS
jgi:uncharacterized membrane protein